jgi:hypothetical protein
MKSPSSRRVDTGTLRQIVVSGVAARRGYAFHAAIEDRLRAVTPARRSFPPPGVSVGTRSTYRKKGPADVLHESIPTRYARRLKISEIVSRIQTSIHSDSLAHSPAGLQRAGRLACA